MFLFFFNHFDGTVEITVLCVLQFYSLFVKFVIFTCSKLSGHFMGNPARTCEDIPVVKLQKAVELIEPVLHIHR